MDRKDRRRSVITAILFPLGFVLLLASATQMGGCETAQAVFNGVGSTLQAVGSDMKKASNSINEH